MVTLATRLKQALKLLLVLAGLFAIQHDEARAQVQFFTSPPDIDSFPIVKSKVSIAYNGRPAPITKGNLSVQEDGQNTDFELLDCDESEAASIAMLFDVSESMVVTLFKGRDEFYRAFIDFTLELTSTSELALIPFSDSVRRIIPASYRAQDFFQMNRPSDVQEFLDSVGGLQFKGNTNVDLGILKAAEHLKKAANRRKAIVLVTDDGIYDRELLIELLKQEEIALFVLELDADTIKGNIVTANETGGKFFSPQDSTELAPTMSLIARAIYAKKCTLRYVSTHPCPWWSDKTLWIGLSYQKQNLAETHYFTLGPNLHDSIAPRLTETSVGGSGIIVRADENFPCERGLKTFTDSALINFAKIKRFRSLPNFGYDSLVIVDLSQAADGYYIAIDSNGNRSQIRITYTPEPDRLSPLWTVPIKTAPEQYQLTVTEFRKWDRGLREVVLVPGSVNIKLDSIVYSSPKLANIYLSRIDPTKLASACVAAADSADNDSSTCIAFEVSIANDTKPPVITQRLAESPYVTLVADVTELQTGDRGMKSIAVSSTSNISGSVVNFKSPFVADVTLALSDSLYSAEALVSAVDSAGNGAQLKLTYSPQPDILSPKYTISVDDLTTRTLAITEAQAWDRGLESVRVVSASNITPSELTTGRRISEWSFASVDPYSIATTQLEAIDSVGNQVLIEIQIPAQTPPVDQPLAYADALDFGTVQAPAQLELSVSILNPNQKVIEVIGGSWTGDDSIFSLAGSLPMAFGPTTTQGLAFAFAPKLLGDWSAVYTIETKAGLKYPIRLKGSSTGTLQLSTSDESVGLSGEAGVLSVSISGHPKVINLDTLRFVIEVDDDAAALERPSNTCATSDWICNYNLKWSEITKGSYALEMIRLSNSRSLELANSPSVSIPFRTYMSGALRTEVVITGSVASRAKVSASNGSISMGEACGDSVIVDALSGEAAGIKEFKATESSIAFDYTSAQNDEISVQLVDMKGLTCHQRSMQITAGVNTISMPISDLTTGSYLLVVSSETGIYSRAFNVVR